MTQVLHRAAGLILSADRLIPGVPKATCDYPADVSFHLGAPAPWRDADADVLHQTEHTSPQGLAIAAVRRTSNGFHFQYADGTDVWVSADAVNVWCTWPCNATLEDTATYLTGP